MRATPGQHQERGRARTGPALRELLPWAPTVLGVCALVVLLIIAATRFTAAPEARAVPPALPFLPVPTLTPGPPSAVVTPSGSTPPDRQVTAPTSTRPSRTPARIPSRTPARTTTAPAPAPGPVSGRYRVIDSYGDAFIGEVLVANAGGRDSDWRVELRFPAAVGDLITSWVESAPQATLRRSGDGYVWSSGVPVPAGGQVALRFHFSRSATGNLPLTCTVNGRSCAGLG
ncbi:hypothetical protein [Actinoplanes sp. NPDC049599]|uniref:hypothetical protein n=1 Tax=Actinoplanes sp. NPDC049599 TaxID=3363903 RepID=UPI0037973461